MANLQSQFIEKTGEVAYTSHQVSCMLGEMDLDRRPDQGRIRKFVKQRNLFVDLETLGIKSTKRSETKYWIPKSNLTEIIDGMNILATESDFEDAAHELKYPV